MKRNTVDAYCIRKSIHSMSFSNIDKVLFIEISYLAILSMFEIENTTMNKVVGKNGISILSRSRVQSRTGFFSSLSHPNQFRGPRDSELQLWLLSKHKNAKFVWTFAQLQIFKTISCLLNLFLSLIVLHAAIIELHLNVGF